MGKNDTQTTIKADDGFEPPATQKRDARPPLSDPAYRWGITASQDTATKEIGKDHPVHKIPLEKQEKMRVKGINPVLKAEMDEATKGEGGFWQKVAGTSFGGGWIK